MNLYAFVREKVLQAAKDCAGGLDVPFDKITVEPCKEPAHGEMATNAALLLAKPLKKAPPQLAAELAVLLKPLLPDAVMIEPAAGFVNIRFHPSFWLKQLFEILNTRNNYGAGAITASKKVNVEYCSANPTGPMHIGHVRGAVFGDVLSSILAHVGHDVTREYYINDAGAQVNVLARSVLLRYREAAGETIGAIPAGLYPGEYLVEVGQALFARDGDRWLNAPEADALAAAKTFAIAAMLVMIKDDLAALGVRFDVFSSEAALHARGAIDAALKTLENQSLLYTGVLEAPKGKMPDDWEERPQLLFRSTQFGDDTDRPIKKADGSATYFAGDIAYHADKIERGFQQLINVMGADHGGYVKRMEAAVAALSQGRVKLDTKLCQLVHLYKDGQPYKMSKRAGTFVTARDLIEDIGRDAVRFMMLTRKNDQVFDFDLDIVRQQTKDNPVFYVQYAHARCASVLRHADEAYGACTLATLRDADLQQLTDPAELDLVRLLAGWPRQLEAAAKAAEPHRLCFALQDIAAAFHALWNKGKDNAELRFILPNDFATTAPRLVLVMATKAVLAAGFQLLNITAVEEMR